MVKVVLNSVPMYQMSTFKMPKKLIKNLDTHQRQFQWGYMNNKGTKFIDWQNLCIPKDLGVWPLETWKCSAKYFKNEDFLHIHSKRYNTSWVCRDIETGLVILQEKYNMEVNNGRITIIWYHNWTIGMDINLDLICPTHISYTLVCEMIPNSTAWNIPLL